MANNAASELKDVFESAREDPVEGLAGAAVAAAGAAGAAAGVGEAAADKAAAAARATSRRARPLARAATETAKQSPDTEAAAPDRLADATQSMLAEAASTAAQTAGRLQAAAVPALDTARSQAERQGEAARDRVRQLTARGGKQVNAALGSDTADKARNQGRQAAKKARHEAAKQAAAATAVAAATGRSARKQAEQALKDARKQAPVVLDAAREQARDRGHALLGKAQRSAGGAVLSALDTKPGRAVAGTAAGQAVQSKVRASRRRSWRMLLALALAGGAAFVVARRRAGSQPDPLYDAAMTNPVGRTSSPSGSVGFAPGAAGTPASTVSTAPAPGAATVEPPAGTTSIDPATAAAATAGSAPEVRVTPGTAAGGTAAGSPLAGVAADAGDAETTEPPATEVGPGGDLGVDERGSSTS